MAKLRLMSNNIWNYDKNNDAWAEKGLDCSPEVRMKGLARLYSETRPDVIGLQEASHKMIDCLMTELAAVGLRYAVHWARFTSILYRPDLFEVLDSEYLCYPDQIEGLPASSYNDVRSKSVNMAVFRVKENGKIFVFGSTHLWWMGEGEPTPERRWVRLGSNAARVYQVGLASDLLAKYQKAYGNCPAVFLGDMNCTYHSAAIGEAFARGFVHARDIAVEYANQENGHHYCGPTGFGPYTPTTYDRAIDHILLRDMPEGAVRRYDRYAPEYYMPISDHIPVWIDVEL